MMSGAKVVWGRVVAAAIFPFRSLRRECEAKLRARRVMGGVVVANIG